ncbi:ankyrin unc44 [Colletotrichum karsti]|uniref:Ankyrin unc44 n=1 Tax=Colletotrichum karsti TaxID=1095194 RepID=A0A9P6HTC5_9PEZI|nr:ankyrin unc44 [Colletotrichum karsti]KAF9870213.1 ankyrin unc44 [Colletotrichum karsti]
MDIDIRELGVSFSLAEAQWDLLGEHLAEALDAIEQILFMFESLVLKQRAVENALNTRQTKPNYRELKHNEKRELGVKIATTFVKAFSTPLIRQRLLDPEYIYLLADESRSGRVISDAYVSFSIGGLNEAVDHMLDMDDGDASILHLAAVLLELELETKIQHGDGASGEESEELFGALELVHSEIQDNIDATFCEIIDHCLQLYAESFEMLDSCGRSEIQNQLFNKVVTPLAQRLEIYRNPKPMAMRNLLDINLGNHSGAFQSAKISTSTSVIHPIMEVNEGPLEVRNEAITAVTVPWIWDPEFLAASTRSSKEWLDRVDAINEYMRQNCRANSASGRVKIALLDTGCDLEASCFRNLSVDEMGITQHWQDWAGESNVPLDEDSSKHGTSMAALLLRVAPHADIYVGRVAKSSAHLRSATPQLIEAMSHAAITWNADIVTMSFGFKSVITQIENQINEIVLQRKKNGKNILFLAAANNDGLNEMELFPANHQDVISVRATTHAGEFVSEYSPNPQPYRHEMLFGTLGHEVPYDPVIDPDNVGVKISGCSVATPILAGLVATIIQFAESSCPTDERVLKAVRSKDGIQAIMCEMGAKTGIHDHRCRYVAPFEFFYNRSQNERVALIRHAVARLPRRT